MKTRRYLYKQRNHGATRYSLMGFERHVKKLGEVLYIRGYIDGKPGQEWNRVAIVGNLGRMILTGFCWGYSGEGPRGLKSILIKLGVPEPKAVAVAHQTVTNQSKKGEEWRITFPVA